MKLTQASSRARLGSGPQLQNHAVQEFRAQFAGSLC